jgi:dihydrolipoamide dehydrogenase
LADTHDSIEVTLEGETPERVQRFGRVLLSVGRGPNSGGLGLEKTNVTMDDRGFIAVDPQRRTADPHILAIGDVAGQPMLAHKAAHEGKVAVEALAGEAAAFVIRTSPRASINSSFRLRPNRVAGVRCRSSPWSSEDPTG